MKALPEEKFWFRAKTPGIGWGRPTCWQGWVVCVTYMALVTVGMLGLSLRFSGRYNAYLWMALDLSVLTPILAIICWLKGPKLRWRREDGDEEV